MFQYPAYSLGIIAVSAIGKYVDLGCATTQRTTVLVGDMIITSFTATAGASVYGFSDPTIFLTKCLTISNWEDGSVHIRGVVNYNRDNYIAHMIASPCDAPDQGSCCGLKPGDRVVLLVNNPQNATRLYAGTMGTVLCCDHSDPDLPLFVSWDNWIYGTTDLNNYCDTPPGAYPPNSGWWVRCADVRLCTGGCTPTPPSTNFDGCGTIVEVDSPTLCCLLFQADAGGFYILDTFGTFRIGDHVRVQGRLTSGATTACGKQVNGSIAVTVIVACPGTCTVDLTLYNCAESGFSPSNIQAGQRLTVRYCGKNAGTTTAPAGWRVRFYASTDATITSNDYFLYEDVVNFAIAPGNTFSTSTTFTFPSNVPPGLYYIGFIFDPDNQICESNENNNAGYFGGYLIVGSFQPSTNFDGCGVLIAVGGGEFPCLLFQADAGGLYYLDNLGGFSTGAHVRVQGQLTPCTCTYCGRQVTGSITVIVIVLCNTCGADFCQYDSPYASFSPSSIRAGQTFHMVLGLGNCGTVDIPAGWTIRYYASLDTTITSSDYFLYETTVNPALPAGMAMSGTEDFIFPSGVPAGQYYVGWILNPDKRICESNYNNDAGYIKGMRLTVVSGSAPTPQ